ncbi:anhydro-N-acetylmuramic acid kinase [Flavobacteriaceae bacterium]|nr:anhydro-N-acetylmuramic acid kinase [Flavobacteriaceae bacterium]MDC0552492.1 anhydro-N-acetylmuramic acid kinase [Flavobacteriaceae bacterium]
MKKSAYHIIGLMSGTSLDGLDICYAQYSFSGKWSFKIIKAVTIPYSKEWIATLKGLVDKSPSQIDVIDKDYTKFLANLVLDFISKYKISIIDAISSHGHTAIHKPNKGLTFQIGNLKILSELTNYTCVCDFRTQDVNLGGQGAPLVPVGDKLLFNKYDFCINLGGFSNISFSKLNKLIAFDICPLNIILNYYSKKLGHDYDYLGYLASTGQIIKPLLENLNSLNYYQISGPKSLGLEWVVENFHETIKNYDKNVNDILKTLVEHAAFQISETLNQYGNGQVLLSGGGTYNEFFIKILTQHSNSKFIIPSKPIIDYKEALIFGFLGVLKLRNEINCMKSVTGASKNHSTGKIYQIFK